MKIVAVSITQSSVRNILLKAASPESFERLRPHLERVEMPLRMVVVAAEEPTRFVHFVESGLASVAARSADDECIEVGHVGCDGMSGSHVLLDVDTTPHHTFMQVEGGGLRIAVPALREAVERDVSLRHLLLRYIHVSALQLSHSVLANGRYNVHQRLARWLLMCHDRIEGDDLPLTHDFLSLMLGVRRSGVTNEIHVIEGFGVIKATRGNIRIVDRTRLEGIAAGAYGVPEAHYESLIGLSARPFAPQRSRMIASA